MPANPNFDSLVTTTFQLIDPRELADNATRSTALLDRLRRKGKVKPADGGRTIVQPLEMSLNQNGGWYSGYDILNTTPSDPFTAAEFAWKQAYVPVSWSGLMERQNMGKSQIIDLIEALIKNARKSLYDLVAQASYSDGTGFGGKQMHGLGLFVVANPTTGSVGGIDRAVTTQWRNKARTVDFDAAVNIASANPSPFLQALNALSIDCSRGSDRPDLYVADSIGYTRYLESLQPIQRITSEEVAGAGFVGLKYFGAGASADFVLDNGYCPAKTVYALNTNYLYLRPHPELNFAPMGGERKPVNQDATVRYFGFMGNMTVSNMFVHGILTDV